MKRDSFFRIDAPIPTFPQRGKEKQRGMSLIEFLIGIAIGLIVVVAAVASLLIVRSSSRTMTDSAALEQQATLALLQIGRQISQAGAHNVYAGLNPDAGVPGSGVPANTIIDAVQFDTRPIGVAADASGIPLSTLPIFGLDGAGSTPDTLYISYGVANDGSTSTGCAGVGAATLAGGAQRAVSVFTVDPGSQSLTCDTNPATSAVPIAGNVAQMRVGYLAVNGTGAITYYANAAAVNDVSNTNWNTINGVQICLELVGDATQAMRQTYGNATNNFTDCDGNAQSPTDGRMHRIVRNTFFLRNTF